MHKDTPPSSPKLHDDENVTLNEEDIIEVYDINEPINDPMLDEDDDDDDEITPDESIENDAKCTFRKHTKTVFCGTLSNDGRLAVTGGEDDKAYVWDTTSGDVTLECTNFKDSVVFVDFNHDSAYVAMGDMSGIIQVWNLSNNSIAWQTEIGDLSWMQWHKAANVLFGASAEGEIYMWRIPDGECKVLQSLQQEVETCCIFPDGKRMAVGYESGTIRILDLKTCAVIHSITPETGGHSGKITSIDCHPSNNLILSAAVDGKTILSTSQTGKVVAVLQNLQQNFDPSDTDMEVDDESFDWVESVSFYNDPEKFIAATGTNVSSEIFIWDIARQTIRHRIDLPCGITKLLWKQGTTFLYSAGLNGCLFCHDGWTGESLKFYSGHSDGILDLNISRDGKIILTSSDDSTARIFEIEH